MTAMPDCIQSRFNIEGIIVNLTISCISSRIQRSHIFILADVVTECIVDGLRSTEHDRTCRITVAVVVLIVCSITVISIPRLSIAVTMSCIQCCKALIVLEDCIFTLPWPDTCCNSSITYVQFFSCIITICIELWLLLGEIFIVDLLSCIFWYIILN